MAFWALKKAKFLPAAQPWWAAGCAVTGARVTRETAKKRHAETQPRASQSFRKMANVHWAVHLISEPFSFDNDYSLRFDFVELQFCHRPLSFETAYKAYSLGALGWYKS